MKKTDTEDGDESKKLKEMNSCDDCKYTNLDISSDFRPYTRLCSTQRPFY